MKETLWCSNCGARVEEGKVKRRDLHRCDAGRPARCGIWNPKEPWKTATKYTSEVITIQ